MTESVRRAAQTMVSAWPDPYLERSFGELGFVEAVEVDADGTVQVGLSMGYPAAGILEDLRRDLAAQLPAGAAVQVNARYAIPRADGPREGRLRGVSQVVAVASGKGGVGKSTTAVNLALALAEEGARVGILDADIYGPSMGVMLGIGAGQRPETVDQQWLKPIRARGIEAISMAMLVTDDTPMVWRGPMASGALQQLLTRTAWSDLDYLIVDMPPGTGDIQLTLAQKVAVAGAVIVTTPQDIALVDARKGIEMFRKVDVPVLGVVENMQVFVCPNCGHAEHLFGSGGGERITAEYGVPLLGALPLSAEIRAQADSGLPSVAADPDGVVSQIYRQIARQVGAAVFARQGEGRAQPEITMVDD